jgi:hypothetical protein
MLTAVTAITAITTRLCRLPEVVASVVESKSESFHLVFLASHHHPPLRRTLLSNVSQLPNAVKNFLTRAIQILLRLPAIPRIEFEARNLPRSTKRKERMEGFLD